MSDPIDTSAEAVARMVATLKECGSAWLREIRSPRVSDYRHEAAATLSALLARCEKAEKDRDLLQLDFGLAESQRDDLRARLEMLEAQHMRDQNDVIEKREQLATAQAREARLRELLEECVGRLESLGSMSFRDRLACNAARAELADSPAQPTAPDAQKG